ncbi:TauD/TfdA family dioxygenase [Novosphingobium sp. P6W]|uniref:TauD/TfdA dioxygenase family protein n=1 Tax=Novosphingobium sp. P6W TaxID=1609758 RepID=UPI0005C2B5CA|nr:TauD/TfdA family dioxygenase [Novosphingobium sp. P6W]AXB78771.1 TauD/TfdA family dioxygenase [Novosphingobium sp. P6W]KIS31780.1 taurine dioxygenase [Novosphingobium sp. P6W]
MTITATRLEVLPVSGRIGAEITGAKLGGDLDAATVAGIRAALLTHKVVFLREQGHLDDGAHQAFARTLGTPVGHPTLPGDGGDFLLELDSHRGGKANSWHTDVTFVPDYPAISILRAVLVPPAGGDTTWANCVSAYERLPASLRGLADGLWAVHSNDYDYTANQEAPDAALDAYQATFASTIIETEHPLVRVHPETGERALVLGSFFKRFVGHGQDEGRRLYDLFQSHVTRLENTVRWRWRVGDVAIWDNRATQHYAIDDYNGAHRVMRRVTLAGEVARGMDGRSSRRIA